MPSKLIGAEITGIEDKDKKIDGKDSNFVKKSYTRLWEEELTDEQRENLKKALRKMRLNIRRWVKD